MFRKLPALLFIYLVASSTMPVALAADPAPTPAPTGTYTAFTNQSCTIGAAGGAAVYLYSPSSYLFAGSAGALTCGLLASAGIHLPVTMKVESWTTKTEWQQLIDAAKNHTFVSTLSKMYHGTVSIGNESVPINGALSYQSNGKYYLLLFSAKWLAYGENSLAGGVLAFSSDSTMSGNGAIAAGAFGETFLYYSTTEWAFAVAGGATVTTLVPSVNSCTVP